MRVVQVAVSDHIGGGGKAVYRLHLGLTAAGVDSWVLVDSKGTADERVINYHSKPFQSLRWKVRARLDKFPLLFTKTTHWDYASCNFLPNPELLKGIRKLRPDLVHLHWIGDGLFPIQYFSKLDLPIVATLHGRWLFNGAQHLHDDRSVRFIDGFQKQNRDANDGGLDIDRWVWCRKKRHLKQTDLSIVTLSRWMHKDAKRSDLLKNRSVNLIPNGVDIHVFKPESRQEARKEFGLHPNKKYLVFGANFHTRNANKGFDILVDAIQSMQERGIDFGVIVFGSDPPKHELPFSVESRFMGFIREEVMLRKVYAAGDCFVLPSHQDNLPNTVMEALACGTPCVAFDVGGVSDMVSHGNNGYLVPSRNAVALASAIQSLFELPKAEWDMMSQNASNTVRKAFDLRLNTARMAELYRNVIERRQ